MGDYEGVMIPGLENSPVWPFYLLVAVILCTIGFVIFTKYPQPVVAAMIASSMIFGFAHFEDWRYVFFANIAGFGYCLHITRQEILLLLPWFTWVWMQFGLSFFPINELIITSDKHVLEFFYKSIKIKNGLKI